MLKSLRIHRSLGGVLLACNVLYGCNGSHLVNSRRLTTTPVVLDLATLEESWYSGEIIPPCVIEMAPEFDLNQCVVSANERRGDPYRILHERLVANVQRLKTKGGEYVEATHDKYALLNEASCTLGIMRSCSLDEILTSVGQDVGPKDFVMLATGRGAEFHPELRKVYPPDYDPLSYDQFRYVIAKGLEKLEELRTADNE